MWKSLGQIEKTNLTKNLLQICWNSDKLQSDCENEFNASVANDSVLSFKNLYMKSGQSNYDSFFTIPQTRSDVTWTSSSPDILSIPFANPQNTNVQNYLQSNIEDEWKINTWHLKLNFIESDSADTTHIVFVPGSTPHVNTIAGSEITMDANSLLTEFDVQWTIRHEYGHVLGFPDCYLEFYDESISAFVSYQLDVTNLMCSRRGHFQQKHFDELKRVYYKQ